MCLRWFKKKILGSSEQTHWVNHIYDESVFWPNKAAMWANVHGFDEGPGATYWVGFDIRTFGIRSADYLIKCKNKSTYDYYINKATSDPEGLLRTMKSDSNLNTINGDDVETEYIFRWGDDDKSFDIHLGWDWYSEEK